MKKVAFFLVGVFFLFGCQKQSLEKEVEDNDIPELLATTQYFLNGDEPDLNKPACPVPGGNCLGEGPVITPSNYSGFNSSITAGNYAEYLATNSDVAAAITGISPGVSNDMVIRLMDGSYKVVIGLKTPQRTYYHVGPIDESVSKDNCLLTSVLETTAY